MKIIFSQLIKIQLNELLVIMELNKIPLNKFQNKDLIKQIDKKIVYILQIKLKYQKSIQKKLI